jgi:hypothetical protein
LDDFFPEEDAVTPNEVDADHGVGATDNVPRETRCRSVQTLCGLTKVTPGSK